MEAESRIKNQELRIETPVIAIIGPTSSGKSDLAIKLAKKFNGVIISADSRQIYRGLDICTGKITKKEQKMVKHHCLDIVAPPKRWRGGVQPFTLADYRTCADRAIQDIRSRGHVPFIVGGTHLYVRAVLYDYDIPSVPPNHEYRMRLEKKSLAALQRQLYKIDPAMRVWKDRDNKRRVLRALEIYRATKRKPSLVYSNPTLRPRYNALQLCVDVPRETLYKRIDKRVDDRIKGGMIREVERLRERGVSKQWLRSLGLECRFISNYLDGKKTKKRKDDMIERLKFAIHHYARRQLTWYRKQNDITYVTSYSSAQNNIKLFLTSIGTGSPRPKGRASYPSAG
ncbi:tRNA (adenosine(37)-N6)-dimethylallyltransferase MiaA [Candidatus Uhrbacteria bacterium]|nr:tRNA (adenosine(37)-N6)-dimethylallyltransferase MiaA [Candidatus Uhrbacteria bacterium]